MRVSRVDAAAATVLVVCWSSGFVGATLGTRSAPVDTVLAWRTLVSALVLGGWALVRAERVAPAAVLRQAALGVLVQVLYLGGVFAAAGAGVSAGTSALVAALQPLLVAALAGPLLAERTTRRQQLGLLIGAVGVAVVVSGDLDAGTAPAWAYLLPVGALVALSAGTLLERRWSPTQSLVTSLALQSTVAAAVFGLAAGMNGHLAPPANDGFWLSIGWLVGLSSFGGYGSYLFIVRRSGATRASTLLYLTPPTTAVWAWLLFGQAPHVLAFPGVVICAGGLALALRRGRTLPRDRDRVHSVQRGRAAVVPGAEVKAPTPGYPSRAPAGAVTSQYCAGISVLALGLLRTTDISTLEDTMATREQKIPGPDHPITVRAEGAHVVAKVGDTVVADTTGALTLQEANYPPAYYLPIADIDPALLRPSDTHSYCPFKGEASYYSLALPGGELTDVAWYYPQPYDAVGEIEGHVAFYGSKVDVTVA